MKKPIVSVVMSIYSEPEEWMRDSIESILNQTFTNFEFIIINDNPERELNGKLLKEYVQKDGRVKIIENDQNIGLTKSLNKGLNKARGKYVARMDGDDVSMPNRLMLQYDFMESHPDHIICGTDVEVIRPYHPFRGKMIVAFSDKDIRDVFPLRTPLAHPSYFMRLDCLNEQNLRYNEQFNYAQDYEFLNRLMCFGKLANIREKLVKYRISDRQISSVRLRDQTMFANKTRFEYLKRKYLFPSDFKMTSSESMYFFIKKRKFSTSLSTKLISNSIASILIFFPNRLNRKHIFREIFFSRHSIKSRVKIAMTLY